MPIYITDTVEQIREKACTELAKQLNFKVNANINKMVNEVKLAVLQFFRNTEIYKSISGDDNRGLDAQFGIPVGTGQNRVEKIIQTFVNTITYSFTPFRYSNGKYLGEIKIFGIRADFQDILSLDEGITENKGQALHWLKWLLLEGDSVIIDNYHVAFGSFGGSRSGKALMFKNGSWKIIPSSYSGTIQDNWITREIISESGDHTPQIKSLMTNIFEKYLGQ